MCIYGLTTGRILYIFGKDLDHIRQTVETKFSLFVYSLFILNSETMHTSEVKTFLHHHDNFLVLQGIFLNDQTLFVWTNFVDYLPVLGCVHVA